MDHTRHDLMLCPRLVAPRGTTLPGAVTTARCRVELAAIRLQIALAFACQHRRQIIGAAIYLAITAAVIGTVVWTMSVDTSNATVMPGGAMPANTSVWQTIPSVPPTIDR